MLSFEVTTVVVILLIFALFGLGAYKAEIALANKAKALQEIRGKQKSQRL